MKEKRIKLTSNEYNLLNDITRQTKTDCWFCLDVDKDGFDYVRDLESGDELTLQVAVSQLNEAIIPDLLTITEEDVVVYESLLKRLGVSDSPFEVFAEVYNGNANGIYTEGDE